MKWSGTERACCILSKSPRKGPMQVASPLERRVASPPARLRRRTRFKGPAVVPQRCVYPSEDGVGFDVLLESSALNVIQACRT